MLFLEPKKVETMKVNFQNLEKQSKEKNIQEIVKELAEILGERMTVFVSGRNNVNALKFWLSGKGNPEPAEELRLRYAYRGAKALSNEYDSATAVSFFMGMNRSLNEEAPASFLRDHEKEKDLEEVWLAVKGFITDPMG